MTTNDEVENPGISGWRKACLLVLFAPPVIFFGGLCAVMFWAWIGAGLYQEYLIQAQFNVYPGAQRVAEGYGYFGAGAGYKSLYYWTDDPVEKIRQHYESFTLPFVKSLAWEVTVFHPFGEVLPVVTTEFGNETVDMAKNRYCYYRVPYECVMVGLSPADGKYALSMPRDMRSVRTPTPLSDDLIGGTLIVYSYYTNDPS